MGHYAWLRRMKNELTEIYFVVILGLPYTFRCLMASPLPRIPIAPPLQTSGKLLL